MSEKQLTDKQLLELAQQPVVREKHDIVEPLEKVIKEDAITDAQKFAITFNLKEGKIKVKHIALWQAYKMWAKDPDNKDQFFKDLNKLFMPYRTAGFRYFMLNKRAWEITWKATQMINDIEKTKT